MAIEAFARVQYEDSAMQLAEIKGIDYSPDELQVAAAGIHSVLMSSWQKFVDTGDITPEGLQRKIKQPATQAELMAESKARYLLLYEGGRVLESGDQLRAFARIEDYRPRFRSAYPNISDLEVMSGDLSEPQSARDGRTLLYHGTSHAYSRDSRVAAYTEESNEGGRAFFAAHGFMQRRVLDPEIIDANSQIRYVHVEAPSIQHMYSTFPGGEHTFTHY